jgi:hypothetical protein
MTSVVPEPDYWLRQVVLVAQRTQARGAQQETAGCGTEPWSRDDWQTVEDTPSKPTRLGIDYIDISGLSSQTAPIRFTFFWTESNRWEGRDYVVPVE